LPLREIQRVRLRLRVQHQAMVVMMVVLVRNDHQRRDGGGSEQGRFQDRYCERLHRTSVIGRVTERQHIVKSRS
jgi:hypothetical protein